MIGGNVYCSATQYLMPQIKAGFLVALVLLTLVHLLTSKVSVTILPASESIGMVSHRKALSFTADTNTSAAYAAVPCIAPYCRFKCQERPLNVTCEPPSREPVRARACNREIAGKHVTQKFFPISFAGFEEDVVACVPKKVRDFASIVPGDRSSYIFRPEDEEEYHRDYRNSRYSKTHKKAGWDCLRHYEILSAGSMPWFPDLEHSPESTLNFLPKKLIVAARDLAGVGDGKINHEMMDERSYYEKTCQLLEYTRRHLTVTAMAAYVLETMGYPNVGTMPVKPKVLLLQGGRVSADYSADLLTIGMRRVLGSHAIDVPYRPYLYEYSDDTPPNGLDKGALYGYGFTYAHRMPADTPINREEIEARIRAMEFDLIIYTCWSRSMPFLETTLSLYGPNRVAIINGDDWAGWAKVQARYAEFWGKAFYFFREMPDGCP